MGSLISYQIVGRYMSGKEVTGYHLQSIDTGKSGKYSRELVAYLVGRGQVTNCTAQGYFDRKSDKNIILFRGKGMSLEDLPIQQEDGTLKNTEALGKISKGTSNKSAMEQWRIIGALKSGRSTVGYIVQNAGCGIKRLKRDQVMEMAQQKKIGNARVQSYNGKLLLRGVDCNLDELPFETIGEKGGSSEKTSHPVVAKPVDINVIDTPQAYNQEYPVKYMGYYKNVLGMIKKYKSEKTPSDIKEFVSRIVGLIGKEYVEGIKTVRVTDYPTLRNEHDEIGMTYTYILLSNNNRKLPIIISRCKVNNGTVPYEIKVGVGYSAADPEDGFTQKYLDETINSKEYAVSIKKLVDNIYEQNLYIKE